MTHTFFPASTIVDAPPPTTLLYPSGAPQPVPVPPVSTPPAESFFSLISLLSNAPLSMSVPPIMHSVLCASRLYRSPAFVRELGLTNPEWNLAHSHPFQSLAFGAFTQTLTVLPPRFMLCILLLVRPPLVFMLWKMRSSLLPIRSLIIALLTSNSYRNCRLASSST
ncbi:hypothetical protein ZOSMA_13G01100 [Zostera marina]|uniref:Uncharacterized protein n=1 Tax=Zostera marina TaxID=29655 RepID=A0A0K9PY93_ZOSMR|nr:hypothetical protein ZOSMA_13G01100 [Zostera marina]